MVREHLGNAHWADVVRRRREARSGVSRSVASGAFRHQCPNAGGSPQIARRLSTSAGSPASGEKTLEIRTIGQSALFGRLPTIVLIALHTREDAGSKPAAPIIETVTVQSGVP
jgi:hypothetical protein